MSIDISGAQVIVVVFNGVLLCLAFFIRLWITRLQSDLDSAKKARQELANEFHAYQLQCARDFAPKADMNHGRAEVMEVMHELNRKVDRIYDKLDTKADKP
jgi:hypothetical protein